MERGAQRLRPTRSIAWTLVGLSTLAVVLAGLALPSQATATVAVNTTADLAPTGTECMGVPGDCSIRRALDKAASTDTISIPANSTHYAVNAGEIVVNKNLTVIGAGAGATVIDAGGASRIFHIMSPATTTTFSSLTMTGGAVNGTGPLLGGAAIHDDDGTLTVRDSVFSNNSVNGTAGGCCNGGGAIWTEGDLSISGSTFTGNRVAVSELAGNCCNGGGAIYENGGTAQVLVGDTFSANAASLTGTSGASCCIGGGAFFTDGGGLTISGSTLNDNNVSVSGSAGLSGGGAVFHDGGDFTITQSTLSGNTASPLGNGPTIGGGAIAYLGGTGVFTHDTIAKNSTSGAGGGILSFPKVTFSNTILASGSAATGPNCSAVMAGTFASAGYNLESADDCGFHGAGDRSGIDPLLQPLASNGGPTETMALPLASPAIDQGLSSALLVDQRGASRPFDFSGVANAPGGDGSDIGAFELQPSDIQNEFSFGKVVHNKRKGTATLTVTVPGPGQIIVQGRGVGARRPARASTAVAIKTVSTGGSVKLLIKPKSRVRKRLKRKGKAQIGLQVTYTPTGGNPNTKQKRLKLIKRKPR